MKCLIHKDEKLRLSKGWKPYNGIDPKMERYICFSCCEYWYKAPKGKLIRGYNLLRG